jgi:hypothetical protein
VTIAHTPLLPRRDDAKDAGDLGFESTAADWHDGQIKKSNVTSALAEKDRQITLLASWMARACLEHTWTLVNSE